MPSVISANIKKRTGEVVLAGPSWKDTYVVKCDAGCTQKQVMDYLRSTKGIAPGLLGDSAMVCDRVSVSAVSLDGQLWEAVADYSRVTYSWAPVPGQSLTPLDESWKIRFGRTSLSQVCEKAYAKWVEGQTEGTPSETPTTRIENTAGDPFDPPIMQDITLQTIELEKNMSTSTYKSRITAGVDDTVNSAAITVADRVIPKWAGKIAVEGSRETYTDPSSGAPVLYMRAKFIITIHPQTWVRFLLNVGLRGYKTGGEGGVLVRAREAGYADKRSDVPVKLDQDGYFLTNNGPGTGVWLAYLTYRPVSWTTLNLPGALTTE